MDDSTDLPASPSRHRGTEQREIDRLWDFADPVASEERFRAASADPERTPHKRAVMAAQLARAVGLQGRTEEALAVLDGVAAAAPGTESGPEAAELRARVALERGRLHAAAGRPEEALPELTRAVREAAAAGAAFLVLDGLHMLALTDGGHEEEWAAEGFDVLAGSRDPRVLRWGIALHNNLGWTKHDGDDPVAALHHFTLAAEAAEQYGSAEQLRVARWSMARALRTLGRTDEALAIQRALDAERAGDPFVTAELEALTGARPTIEA